MSRIGRAWREGKTDAATHFHGFSQILEELESFGFPDVRELRVLDIGCGERAPLSLLFAAQGARVDGIDLLPVKFRWKRPVMWVESSTQFGVRSGLRLLVRDIVHTPRYWRQLRVALGAPLPFERVQIQKMDAAELVFPDNSFDIIVSSAVWEHLLDVQAATQELNRVLAPDGLAMIQVAPFPSLQGGHHSDWHSCDPGVRRGLRPWEHLYDDGAEPPLYCNRWRQSDYRAVFAATMDVQRWDEGEPLGREFLLPEIRTALSTYTERDLLTASITVWARKRQVFDAKPQRTVLNTD